MLLYKCSQAGKNSSSSGLTVVSDKSVLIERKLFFFGSNSMLFIVNCLEGKEKEN